YGGHREPATLTVHHTELLHATENESFFSSILEIKVGEDLTQQAVVRDLHRHPFKPVIMHIDFMRVSAEEVLRISVPIHFMGENESPAGKASGVVIQHQMTEVEIAALPKNIPEFLSADLSKMKAGESVMLSSILLPEGVTIPLLEMEGGGYNPPVANAVHVKESQGTGAAAAAEEEAALAEGELGVAVGDDATDDATDAVDDDEGEKEDS
ncbi:MAG: 50S ribosomal protein L25, partial [Xanthomonadales bacterium]|nr:50S ribosomal protein L25 [Xanthomonadales bacterium]